MTATSTRRGAKTRIIPNIWWDVDRIPDAELWRTHERRRERLVSLARIKLRAQLEARGAAQAEIEAAGEILNPDALTIGFARRFATYKRATLLFRDKERLAKMVNNPEPPGAVHLRRESAPARSPRQGTDQGNRQDG